MKKFITVLVLVLVCAGFVCAQGFTGEKAAKGGFSDGTNASAAITPVSKALKMRDDTHAVLRGNIVKQVGHEKYLFKDATGEIVVEIDDEDWGGVTVGPQPADPPRIHRTSTALFKLKRGKRKWI